MEQFIPGVKLIRLFFPRKRDGMFCDSIRMRQIRFRRDHR